MERNIKHGLSKHPLYNKWTGMRERCYKKDSPRYPRYGGRGIIICDEWKNNFKAFYDWAIKNGFNKGLEIDRIDNNGNYVPGNCRFVDHKVQMNNRNIIKNVNLKPTIRYQNDQRAKDGTYNLKISVCYNRISRYIGTGLYIRSDQINDKGSIINHPDASIINFRVANIINEMNSKILNLGNKLPLIDMKSLLNILKDSKISIII